MRLALRDDPSDLTPDFLGADYTVVAGPRTPHPVALPQQRTDSPSVATAATAAVSAEVPLRQIGGDTQGPPPGDSWGLPPSKVGD